MPCLVEQTADGELAVWDSLAIVEYLAEQYPNTWPSDKAARAWARSASAEMHSGFAALRDECSMNCGVRVELNALSDTLSADLARLDALWQQGLERFGGPFWQVTALPQSMRFMPRGLSCADVQPAAE